MLFCKGECKLAVNRHQGIYDNSKVLPQVYCERVLDLHHQGFSLRQISQNMRVSVGYVNKVVQFYENNNSSLAAPWTTPVWNKMSADVVEYLESTSTAFVIRRSFSSWSITIPVCNKKVHSGRLQNDKEKGLPNA